MALEAVYQQEPFVYNNGKDFYPLLLETWATSDFISFPKDQQPPQNYYDYYYDDDGVIDNNNIWDYNNNVSLTDPVTLNNHQQWAGGPNSSPDGPSDDGQLMAEVMKRPKRRRARAKKNKEDVENQRMTHIAVERNRRKQMNDYLNVLRSLMPDSYVQRGDQASIIGGAINFVKELEQNVQCLSANKKQIEGNSNSTTSSPLPFGDFFMFPQFSTTTLGGGCGGVGHSSGDNDDQKRSEISHHLGGGGGGGGGGGFAVDIEVTMVESHAHLKIRLRPPSKQLSKLVSGLMGLRLTILHLNVTTVQGVALYSFSVKVEDESKLSSVDEIAGAVYQLVGRIQDEATFNS